MTAPISIIIPTLNAAEALPYTLASLTEGLRAGLIRELVISDGGSQDATPEIADAVGAEFVSGAASRGGQVRRGIEIARSDWLLILHADTRLQEGWTATIQSALKEPGAYHFRLRFDDPSLSARWVAGWANLRSWLFRLPYGDQGLLIHKQTLSGIGGYPDLPLMEDVALARRLRRGLTPLPILATTSAEKYRRQGWLKRGGRNLWTLTRYLAGGDPEGLARSYRR